MRSTAEAVLKQEPTIPASVGSVEELRSRVDTIDEELVELLAERCRLARGLGEVKRAADLPVVDHAREAVVVRRAGSAARREGLDEELMRRLFWDVIELARRAQGPGA